MALLVGLLAFPFAIGSLASQFADRSWRLFASPEGFNAVPLEDPTCAIAYWGIALSDWSNPFASGQKDKGQLQLGRPSAERGQELGAKTDRERAYLAAVGKLYDDFEVTPQQVLGAIPGTQTWRFTDKYMLAYHKGK